MFRIKNNALVKALKDFRLEGVKDLYLVEEDIVKKFAPSAHSNVVFEQMVTDADPLTRPGVKKNAIFFSRVKTIQRIIEDNTFVYYMSREYWQERHNKQATQFGIGQLLREAVDGNKTIEALSHIQVSCNIKPGEEAVVDWTKEFIEQRIQRSPWWELLEVEDMATGEILTRDEPTEPSEPKIEKPSEEELMATKVGPGEVPLSQISYDSLKKMAKERGIRSVGVSKVQLIEDLAKILKS